MVERICHCTHPGKFLLPFKSPAKDAVTHLCPSPAFSYLSPKSKESSRNDFGGEKSQKLLASWLMLTREAVSNGSAKSGWSLKWRAKQELY